MGLFDNFLGMHDAEIALADHLVRNYYEGFCRWKNKNFIRFDEYSGSTIKQKIFVAQNEYAIKAYHKEVLEEKAFETRKKDVITAAKQYPEAFAELAEKLTIYIPDVKKTEYGNRKSRRQIRLENEELARKLEAERQERLARERLQKKAGSEVISPLYSARPTMYDCHDAFYWNEDYCYRSIMECVGKKTVTNSWWDGTLLGLSSSKKPRSISNLENEEYEKLYKRLAELPARESAIKKKILDEEIRIRFDDEILEDKIYAFYYQKFLTNIHRRTNDKQYVLEHKEDLKKFVIYKKSRKETDYPYIFEYLRYEYLRVECAHPYNKDCTRKYVGFDKLDDLFYLCEEHDLTTLNRLAKKFSFIKCHNAVKRHMQSKQNMTVATALMELSQYYANEDKLLEVNKAIANAENKEKQSCNWTAQREKELIPNWYSERCTIPISKPSFVPNQTEKGTYYVNHQWCETYCDATDLDYRLWPTVRTNITEINELLSQRRYYREHVYDAVFNYIKAVWGETSVVFSIGGSDDERLFQYHYGQLIQKLNEAKIEYCFYSDNNTEIPFQKFIVVELSTTTERLQKVCDDIVNHHTFTTTRFRCNQHVVVEVSPLFSYVSLNKVLTRKEANTKIAEREEQERQRLREEQERQRREREQKEQEERLRHQREEEERRKREEEERRKAEEQRKIEEAKNILEKQLTNAVLAWETPRKSTIPCFSLYNYYPTTCEFEIGKIDHSIRVRIWQFKANPQTDQSVAKTVKEHDESMHVILPYIQKLILKTFGDNAKKLTLCCVPASNRHVNILRYKDFANELCSMTYMSNAFDHIIFHKDGEAKHAGGTEKRIYELDKEYFNGRYVILFDDIITTGTSMETFRMLLEKCGANVIAGISLGRTYHAYQGEHPLNRL